MEKDVKWIKISVNMFSDDKIKQIRSLPDGNSVLLIWVQLLLLAGRINHEGMLVVSNTEIPYTEEMMATAFDMPLKTVIMAINTFKSFGMVDLIDDVYHITNWAKHQALEGMEKIREQNRTRKQAQREREKVLPPADAVPALPAPEPKETPLQRRFARFWKAYPRKTGKGAAEKSFAKYKPDDDLTETMIRAVEAAKRSPQWQKDNGQYIPYPATWLNQKRWEDEEPLPFAEPPEPAYIRDESIEDWN